jgi:hypothetical protein
MKDMNITNGNALTDEVEINRLASCVDAELGYWISR